MAIKVKVTLPIRNDVVKGLNSTTVQRRIGNEVVHAIKATIASGQSPVRGQGRFEEYAASRNKRQGKASGYPLSVQKQYPGKKIRPVNLFLSGDMIDDLQARPNGAGIPIGFSNKEQADKAAKHNSGDKVPVRRVLPNKRGEEFTVGITRLVRDLYAEELERIIKK